MLLHTRWLRSSLSLGRHRQGQRQLALACLQRWTLSGLTPLRHTSWRVRLQADLAHRLGSRELRWMPQYAAPRCCGACCCACCARMNDIL